MDRFLRLAVVGSLFAAGLLRPAGAQRPPLVRVPLAPVAARALVITHASSLYDKGASTRPAVRRLARRFHAAGLPAISLMGMAHDPATYFAAADGEALEPVASEGGEHSLSIASSRVTTGGGYLHRCHSETIRDLVNGYFANAAAGGELTLDYVADAIFVAEEDIAAALQQRRARPAGFVGSLASILEYLATPAEVAAFFRQYLEISLVADPLLSGAYRVRLMREGRELEVLQVGAPGSPTVTLNLTTSRSLALPGDPSACDATRGTAPAPPSLAR